MENNTVRNNKKTTNNFKHIEIHTYFVHIHSLKLLLKKPDNNETSRNK